MKHIRVSELRHAGSSAHFVGRARYSDEPLVQVDVRMSPKFIQENR